MDPSSNSRRSGTGWKSPCAIGGLPVPDSRTWPDGIKAWFRDAVGEYGPLDVFIFHYGHLAAMYLQDAITAAAILGVDASEWHVERGYPAFYFDPARISEIQRRLGNGGYVVTIVEMDERRKQRSRKRKRGAVVNIASAREKWGTQTI